MNKTIRTLVYCTLLCSSLHVVAQHEIAETHIDSIMKRYNMVGLSTAVVKKGKVIYTHSFGVKNIATQTQLSNTDLFRIASISKSFSATSIMQLVEAKKLSLNDNVSKLIGFTIRNPKFPDIVITLKMLLSHTSSLNDALGYFTLDIINPNKNPDYAKCYNNYAPGAGYEYCNLNFNLVGTIIERVSGERFDKYIKHYILDPLGLYAGFEVGALDSSRFVTLYEYDSAMQRFTVDSGAYNPRKTEINNYVMGYSTPIFSPAGGMKISVTDLTKYMMMHMNLGKYNGIRIISKKSAKTMQTAVSDGDVEGKYGLAILITDKLMPGVLMKGHTGSAYGLYSMMFFQPHKKFGIIAITNGMDAVYDSGYNPVMQSIVNVLYDEIIK